MWPQGREIFVIWNDFMNQSCYTNYLYTIIIGNSEIRHFAFQPFLLVKSRKPLLLLVKKSEIPKLQDIISYCITVHIMIIDYSIIIAYSYLSSTTNCNNF